MNTKNKAPMPEKIVAWQMHPSKVNEDLHGGWAEVEDKREVSYTRTDVAQAQVAAAYEAAASARGMWFGFNSQGEPTGEYCTVMAHDPGGMSFYISQKAIRTLTPTDAKAALDRIVQEAVKGALTVKPLVWELDSEYWVAETPFGDVSVYYDGAYGWLFDDDETSPKFLKYPSSFGEDSGYESAEAAKESIEAQTAQRILSALKGGEA